MAKKAVKREGSNLAAFVAANFPTPITVQRFYAALTEFSLTDEDVVERQPKCFSKCPIQEIDDYFEVVAKIGKPLFKWNVIKPAFLWKLERVMSEMYCVEKENAVTEDDKKMIISDEELSQQRQFIMQKATEFDGTPFTFQRLCELITTPTRNYKRTNKYLRALEKNINVVTTINENAERVTGAEPFQEESSTATTLHIEQPFFVQVDEYDTPLEAQLADTRQGSSMMDETEAGVRVRLVPVEQRFCKDYFFLWSGPSETVTEETVADESAPTNLSASGDIKEESPETEQQDSSNYVVEGGCIVFTEPPASPDEEQHELPVDMEVDYE